MKRLLTIAGSDCSGGAGIQADLKTFAAHHVYGMSAITALTAQNTLGVQAIHEAPVEFVEQELESVFQDIVPDAVKVGMVSSAPLIRAIAAKLRQYAVRLLVVDPVMVSTSGSRLLAPEAPEATALTGMEIHSPGEMTQAARMLARKFPGVAILVKGGHAVNDANDLLVTQEKEEWFPGKRVDTPNTHGTGCTLSSAIAANLALGHSLPQAIQRAKEYIVGALSHDPRLGHGQGPMDHLWVLPPTP